jgi:hypothetical protein
LTTEIRKDELLTPGAVALALKGAYAENAAGHGHGLFLSAPGELEGGLVDELREGPVGAAVLDGVGVGIVGIWHGEGGACCRHEAQSLDE